MTAALRVAPARVVRRTGLIGRAEPGIRFLVQIWVKAWRRVARGRAVGLACTVARLLGKDGLITFELAGGGLFAVEVDDRYWLLPLLLDQSYELDLDHFLARSLRPQDVFLDCGANLGLWSIAAARVASDPAQVVSVEAGTDTFKRLTRNQLLNAQQFTIRHLAISEKGDEQLRFYSDPTDHASSTLLQALSPMHAWDRNSHEHQPPRSPRGATRHGRPTDNVTFVKLDIEGAEQLVLGTISPRSQNDLIVLYEDHGRDREHGATILLLEQGFAVAHLGVDGTVERISAQRPERLSTLKPDERRGYNFVAWGPEGTAAERMMSCFHLR